MVEIRKFSTSLVKHPRLKLQHLIISMFP